MTESINNHIVVVGEALIDVVAGPNGERRVPGGSPMNVAVGLSRLQRATTLVTDFGDDADGALLQQHLDRAGVAVHRPGSPQRVTSTAHASIGADGSATYEFNVPWNLDATTLGSLPVTPSLVHTGSIGALLRPGSDAVATYFASMPIHVTRTFDPNIREALLPNRAEAQAAVTRLAALSDVVKLSDEDAAWIFPGYSDAAVIDALLAGRTSLVAITHGREPAVLGSKLATAMAPALEVKVADTIGAGDAFMSGFIDAWLETQDATLDSRTLQAIGSHATLCAALTVEQRGAVPPTRDQLHRAAAERS
ncbi:fructokinase [Curtobacterium pusillum]|uniref:Fructokinase n=1 Tax=Curtobacterium pusillum TaxID=69373 RepID=A0AAW3TC68_9MICO|nr:carbohydrate kinase [Curtobacterium pusillum]MBA8992033.1 fructokinase [Curtobacterium pusillum]